MEKGLTFGTIGEFREVLREYKGANGLTIHQKHKDKKRFMSQVQDRWCPWNIVASSHQGGLKFMIRSYVGMHTCKRKNLNR